MEKYYFKGGSYVIEDFDKLPVFSSFLPGLAGVKGIPLWVYYTNRGQAVNSFGIHHKNNAIMEFNPANTAYENTSIKGFRTFIKCNNEFFEPFSVLEKEVKRNMYIRKNSFEIEEIHKIHKVKVKIKYYVLPNDSIGGLVRKVYIENLENKAKKIEVLDGIPKMIPYGISNEDYKSISNLLKSWTEIKNIEEGVPFYTMRSSSNDSAQVSEVEGGYFYLSISDGKVLPVIYDPEAIFGYDYSLQSPIAFLDESLEGLKNKKQSFYNKIPCGFTAIKHLFEGEGFYEFHTLIGFSQTPEQINNRLIDMCSTDYFLKKAQETDEIVDLLTSDIKTHSSKELFDQYMEQCYLDNFLRGGYPFVFNEKDNKAVVHLFNRKHGDPERDYNFFSVAGEYYSQGNGNFRDVNQNRRNDIFFNPAVGDFNIKTFFQLIQIDGFNPLEIRPSTFTIKDDCKSAARQLIKENIKEKYEEVIRVIEKDFTPGQISNCIARFEIYLECDEDKFLETLLSYSYQNIEAAFKEGYWSDHWNYNMDLIDSYLKVYPEKEKELLFGDSSYRFYDSPVCILPRNERNMKNQKGQQRQYNFLILDEEKLNQEKFNKNGTNWLKTKNGSYATTTLMGKLISLALNKFASFDSYGMGIEMEAGKPGWNDAMNGLPGLYGSGMSETFELKRMIEFICSKVTLEEKLLLPLEVYEFLNKVSKTLINRNLNHEDEYVYWDKISTFKEEFREKVRFHLDGAEILIDSKEIKEIFHAFGEKVEEGIHKACKYGEFMCNHVVPTYFTFEGEEVTVLPAFLEGPTKMLASVKEVKRARELHKRVKSSNLFDKKLKMYKTSVPLDDISMENGRIRAFTAGWLERESIFLHMEYKYLLSMLKAGLYEEFFEEMPDTFVVFRDPKEYGRSTLENSSFLASSVNPDESVHGRGYVARLSGSTTEAISMWILMFIGDKIFTYKDGNLQLHFEPKLPSWIFDSNDKVSFMFLSKCKVTYCNPSRKNTYGEDSAKVRDIYIEDTKERIESDFISGELAEKIRNGQISELVVNLI